MRKAIGTLAILSLAGLATAQPKMITTTFASNNGGSTDWVNMFDVTVNPINGIAITRLDVNISSAANTAFTIDVYTTTASTTYVGSELVPANWTKVSSGAGIAVGRDMPTPVDVTDFLLPQGSTGFAVHYTGAGMAYSGTSGTPPVQNYSNAEVSLQLGASTAGFFTGTLFSPRAWNGTIYYTCFLCAAPSTLKIGTPGLVRVAGGPGGDNYQIAASFGDSTRIPAGPCAISLNPDDLFRLSVLGLVPAIFNGYGGVLPASGQGGGTFTPPNLAALVGLDIYHAAVTFNAGGVTDCSNTAVTKLAP